MLIVDLIGYCAIVFGVLAFLNEERQKMLLLNALSTLAYGINVLFYEGLTGAILSFFSFTIILISLRKNERLNKNLTILAPVVGILTFVFLAEGWVGFFPALGIFFATWANLQKEILKMKYIFYGSATSWLIFGLLIGSIPAILLDVFGLIALTYGIRSIKKKNNQPIAFSNNFKSS